VIDREILQCFLDEALDSLAQWERAVLDLETTPSEETYNVLFRAAHNLKGASRAVGLDAFGAFVHRVEDLITFVMKGTLSLNPAIVGVLLTCQVELVNWIQALKENPEAVPELALLQQKLEAVTQLPVEEIKLIAEALKDPTTPMSKPEAPMSIEDELEKAFAQAQQEYQNSAHSAKEPSPPEPPAAAAAVESVRPADEDTKTVVAVSGKTAPAKPVEPAKPGAAAGANPKSDETIRVAANKIDELLQLIGELSIHQAIVDQGRKTRTLDSRISLNAIHLSNKIVKDLYGKTLSLRMQPVQSLFQRLERTARDVARAQSKKIQVVLEGTEVELDKTVIERITDPLIHILRNAVDHGIESAEDRKKTTKPEIATVRLSATQEPSGVCLRVSEDGRGLNRDRIIKKALEKGLISDASNLTQQQINNLIFLPNFSTAEKVTDISGRGVGMDVVSKSVQALQGTIDLATEPGKGTTFSIMLPTSLSIIEALVIKISNLRYAIAMHELTEIIDLKEFTIETSGSKGRMFSLRGDIVPVQALSEYLKVPTVKKQAAVTQDRGRPALVVRDGEDLIAFEVDDILGQQQVVVRPLSEQLASLEGFSGSMILGDGEPGMIVSLTELARNFLKSTGSRGETRV
jgi:two-component system chemotaxis sensor kinase CheA